MKTQDEIYQAFDKRISLSAIKYIDGSWMIVGRFCFIEKIDDMWDLFICNTKDMVKGLGARKVSNIQSSLLSGRWKGVFTTLTGETYTRVAGTELILDNLKLLGIRKRSPISKERRAEIAKNLEKWRKRSIK